MCLKKIVVLVFFFPHNCLFIMKTIDSDSLCFMKLEPLSQDPFKQRLSCLLAVQCDPWKDNASRVANPLQGGSYIAYSFGIC